ncbi:MAG: hypothetical protein PHF84_07530 [bacterium]|nr:hypothetical protein [bacterium]
MVYALSGLVFLMYIISFYPVLDMNGDNASYLLRAKSLLAGKGFRDLYLINEPLVTHLRGFSFSLMYVPLLYLFHYNFILLKLFPFICTFLLFFFIYHFYRKKMELFRVFILVVFVALNSQIVHFSSLIMTENVFLAFLVLFFILLEKQTRLEFNGKSILYSILLVFFSFICYMIREAGIAILVIGPLYMLITKKIKFLLVMLFVLLLIFGGYLKYSGHLRNLNMTAQQQSETSVTADAESSKEPKTFSERSWIQIYPPMIIEMALSLTKPEQIKKAFTVMAQKFVGDPDENIFELNWLKILAVLVLLSGIYFKIRSKGGFNYYDLFGIFTFLFLTSSAGDPVVLSRYFIILIPLFYVYFFQGLSGITSFLPQLVRNTVLLSVCGLMLASLLTINCKRVYQARNPYPPVLQFYIQSAEWVKKNVPSGALVSSRKSSLYYIWSDHKCIHYFDDLKYSRDDRWSRQFEADTLKYYQKNRIRYVVWDSFSSDAVDKILPIIQNHPDLFEVMYSPAQFNIPENYIKDLNTQFNVINLYYQRARQVYVPTVVLKIKQEFLDKAVRSGPIQKQ